MIIPALIVDGEVRYALVNRIGATFWTAIFTMRHEAIRIISVRRSRDNEREWCEEAAEDAGGDHG